MSELSVNIYTSNDTLPAGLSEENLFHSPQLFAVCKLTPRMRPYMVTVETADGEVVAQMLAVVRYRASLFPPYLYRHCRIMGEGVYVQHSSLNTQQPTLNAQHLFGLMLKKLTSKLSPWVLYIEVSNLSQKMFAYRQFRENHFFPVRWMSIHNSLHSHTPEERLTPKMLQRISRAYQRGIITDEVKSPDDFKAFSKLLHHHNWLKPKRYIPADAFFLELQQRGLGRLFVTRYHDRVVGCSAVVYSQQQAYLWYSAFLRKSYAVVHPDVLTIWHAIKHSHRQACQHIFFIDVGLPFRKNHFRDFILSFGGKPVSTYRWFHCSISWVNRLLSWIYRD